MNLILAPLQGVTGYAFRNCWSRFFSGLDEAVTPFIPAITGNRVKPLHIRDVLPENNTHSLRIIPQVLANQAGGLQLLAQHFASLGYTEMNWNLGCPSAIVTRRRRGCGLMPFPDEVDKILNKLMPDLPLDLSVKLRLGMRSKHEISAMLKVLNRYPLSRIILHPRLGTQMYEGTPDLDSFALAWELSAHPVVYNGDILIPEDILVLQRKFPKEDQWMIGRGVLKNPFLPEMICGKQPVNPEESNLRIIAFYADLERSLKAQGITDQRLCSRLKEYWFYFSHWFAEPEKVWHAVSRSNDLISLQQVTESLFSKGIDVIKITRQ